MKVIEFDFNQQFIYLPDEDWQWVMSIMNDKLFPSATPICDGQACWFTNPCEKVGLTGVDFSLELHTPTVGKMYDFSIDSADLFISGEHVDGADYNSCYLAIFNFGKLSDIDKRNKWVFGKYMMKDYYLIFDATVKEEDNDAWLQVGIANVDIQHLEVLRQRKKERLEREAEEERIKLMK